MKNFNKILAILVILLMYVILSYNVIHYINYVNTQHIINYSHSSEFILFSNLMAGISILFAGINIIIMTLYNEYGKYLIFNSNKMIVKSSVYIIISQTMLIWALFLTLLTIKIFGFVIIPIGTILISAIMAGIITNLLLYTISINYKEK